MPIDFKTPYVGFFQLKKRYHFIVYYAEKKIICNNAKWGIVQEKKERSQLGDRERKASASNAHHYYEMRGLIIRRLTRPRCRRDVSFVQYDGIRLG